MRISINTDKEKAKMIKESIVKNGGFCTCQLEKNEDTRCICRNFLNKTEIGWCFCGLYYKEEI